jgi:hypothetical protein
MEQATGVDLAVDLPADLIPGRRFSAALRVDDGVRITFDRAAVWQVEPRGSGDEPAAEKGKDNA